MVDRLVENDQLVDALRGAARDGTAGLRYVPQLMWEVMSGDPPAWARRFDRERREEVGFKTLAEFISATPTAGLGMDPALFGELLPDKSEVKDRFDELMQRPVGTNQHSEGGNNVPSLHRPEGNTAAKALRRLRKDAPELHAQVLAGKLSAHRAMVNAGFRKRTATVPVDDPIAAARTIRRQFGREALIKLIAALIDPEDG